MTPLRITARLLGPISLPHGPLHLDGLLAWSEAQRQRLPPIGFAPLATIEIPVEREPGGRFHLCSSSLATFDSHESRYVNRRFPLEQAQVLGDAKLKRIHLGAGATKSYRIPTELAFAEGDMLTWFAIGDRDGIVDLLAHVTHLGKRRAVGRGRVDAWTVEPCEPWGDGFPVVREGRALRPLPPDWPGLVEPVLARAALTYPFWDRTRVLTCAVPEC